MSPGCHFYGLARVAGLTITKPLATREESARGRMSNFRVADNPTENTSKGA